MNHSVLFSLLVSLIINILEPSLERSLSRVLIDWGACSSALSEQLYLSNFVVSSIIINLTLIRILLY